MFPRTVHQPPLLDLLDLVEHAPQDGVPVGKDGLHLLDVARLPAHVVGQVVGHQQNQVVHVARAQRVPHGVRAGADPKVHRRPADERRQLRVRRGLREVQHDAVRQVPRGQRRARPVAEVTGLAPGPHAVGGDDKVGAGAGARLGRDLGGRRVQVEGLDRLAQAEPHAELLGARVQGELEVDAVHVEEGGAVLGPDILVKVGLVGEHLARVAVDGQRAGLGRGLPEFVLEAPFLEDLGGVGGDLETGTDLDDCEPVFSLFPRAKIIMRLPRGVPWPTQRRSRCARRGRWKWPSQGR